MTTNELIQRLKKLANDWKENGMGYSGVSWEKDIAQHEALQKAAYDLEKLLSEALRSVREELGLEEA